MPNDKYLMHPERGSDPRFTYCKRCHTKMNEVIVGDNVLLQNSTTNQAALSPANQINDTASKMGWKKRDYTIEEVPPDVPLPATNLCDSCKEEVKVFEAVVQEGGIYWFCTDCGISGVIAKNDFTAVIRTQLDTPIPESASVEFGKCEEHTKIWDFLEDRMDQDDLSDKKES